MSWTVAFTVLEVVWLITFSGWILLEKRSPTATIAWILGLALLPAVGLPIYFLMGPRRLERKKLRLSRAREVVGRQVTELTLDELNLAQREHLLPLMRLCTRLDGMAPMNAIDYRLFRDGDSAYAAIETAIRAARHHVHLEYYIIRDDSTGQRLLDLLVEKAKEGVQVRLLADSVGSRLSRANRQRLADAGARFAWFNPAALGRLRRRILNFRTHRKIVVVDGLVGFTGGINVCDDHSARARGGRAWRDTHLMLTGEVVHGLQRTFVENWVFSATEKLPLDRLEPYFPPCERGEHLAQIVASGPDSSTRAIEALYLAAIGSARKRVWLTTPYLVPDEPLLSAICLAGLRGVDVQLVLPGRTDSRMVDAAGASCHDILLKSGVRLHIFGPPMIHAKTAVIDDDLAIVGTANLDDRSMKLNFEVVAACYGGPIVEQLATLFRDDCERSKLKLSLEQNGPLGRRLLQSAARLFWSQL